MTSRRYVCVWEGGGYHEFYIVFHDIYIYTNRKQAAYKLRGLRVVSALWGIMVRGAAVP